MLLLGDGKLEERQRAARTSLRPLFDGLAGELGSLLGREPHIPASKALLSRAGGRCEKDGAVLEFDPGSPQEHRCPTCGTIHRGELHHRAWITSYQLWLAERAVHGALFDLLRPDASHAELSRDILRAYADLYLAYPNVDNVLGPTRLFFSTYLESIWLLQICIAADLLEQGGDSATADLVRDRIVEPSRELIAEYDEGMSNRQVWNNAALLAAAALCDDDNAFDARVGGESGLAAHLAQALLADGTWYEGDNYHQFALRGLWYGVTLCETRGRLLDAALVDRFQRAFATPYLTALPDFTMPARKDSQYAVSLRQWRLAELMELGYARGGDALLAMALARCYEPGHERRDTGRSRSTADVERNGPSGALGRSDLGWRALLHALPVLPPLPAGAPRSTLLDGQGLAVFRRADDVYVALDYGQAGGGHGHPDRLNVMVSQGATRWLDDMGTGSYVDPSLHWYRSTLAHSAPLCDGKSQELRDGLLRAYEEREGMGWIEAHLPDVSGVSFARTIVVAPTYLLDELRWWARRPARIELPLHVDASVDADLEPAGLDGGHRAEDGFSYLTDTRRAPIPAGSPVQFRATRDGRTLNATLFSEEPVTLFSATGPGQPATSLRRLYVARAEIGEASAQEPRTGAFRSVLAWSNDVVGVRFDASTTIELREGERHVHRRARDGWRVELHAGAARSSIDLGGVRPMVARETTRASRSPVVLRRSRRLPEWLAARASGSRPTLIIFDLAEAHYRRSELDWHGAGEPRATVALAATDRGLVAYAVVRAGDRRFIGADALNALDNEHADTMGAGMQLYVRLPTGSGAWMLVPDPGSDSVRVRAIEAGDALAMPEARWRERDDGYEVRVDLPLSELAAATEFPIDVDVIVNETTAERQRRRGQLVMSGARREFVYLRGDRHDPERFVPLIIVP